MCACSVCFSRVLFITVSGVRDWIVYMLQCEDETFYIGVTNDLEHRVAVHNAGKGAKYTRGRLPVRVVWSEEEMTRSEALKRECELKKLSRAEKMALFT